MTKSQNTKNEQQKDLCITSEQLTEQWKKGELPIGWYYVKIADIVFIDFFEGKVWKNKKDEYIDKVLAPVPSYEQWQAKLKENAKLKKQLAIAVEALERYATGTDKTKESDEEGNEYEFEYPLTNDDGETAKEALKQIKGLDK